MRIWCEEKWRGGEEGRGECRATKGSSPAQSGSARVRLGSSQVTSVGLCRFQFQKKLAQHSAVQRRPSLPHTRLCDCTVQSTPNHHIFPLDPSKGTRASSFALSLCTWDEAIQSIQYGSPVVAATRRCGCLQKAYLIAAVIPARTGSIDLLRLQGCTNLNGLQICTWSTMP